MVSSNPEIFCNISGRPDASKWMKAVEEELQCMRRNNFCRLMSIPKVGRMLRSHWTIKIKDDQDGLPTRYKARLDVRVFLQRSDVDRLL